MRDAAFILVVLLAALLASACSDPAHERLPVPVPDTTSFEPAVRAKLASARAAFDRIAASKPDDRALADAYGELAMNYHAHDLTTAAEAAYANARALAPHDRRWPYLLGHLYNDSSRIAAAKDAFDAALAIEPNDAPTQIYLAQVLLTQGDLDRARTLFEQATSREGARAAALTGLGKVALAQGDYPRAVERFEAALALEPAASRLRQPLAVAYRRLGQTEKADQNVARYAAGGSEPVPADPVVDALGSKVASSHALIARGRRAARAQQFEAAVEAFTAAIEADPRNAEALTSLGIALANLGRIDDAQRRLEQSLAIDDTSALAHFSLGAVLDRQGKDQPAIAQYEATLARDGGNNQARMLLADATMRVGRAPDAIPLYRKAIESSPNDPALRVSLAMAYINGGNYRQARELLEEAHGGDPAHRTAASALARVLATAPDASLRDGARALQIAEALFQAKRNADAAQTYAMALAEAGRFEEAVKVQQETITAFERARIDTAMPFLERNLARYKARKPTREGWASNDTAFRPRNPAVTLAKSAPST